MQENLENLTDLQFKIFSEEEGKLYIGGEEIKEPMRGVLKDQAEYLKTSQLLEIINATIINEAFNLGVLQSKDWDNVQFAKALYYWNKALNNLITKLSK